MIKYVMSMRRVFFSDVFLYFNTCPREVSDVLVEHAARVYFSRGANFFQRTLQPFPNITPNKPFQHLQGKFTALINTIILSMTVLAVWRGLRKIGRKPEHLVRRCQANEGLAPLRSD